MNGLGRQKLPEAVSHQLTIQPTNSLDSDLSRLTLLLLRHRQRHLEHTILERRIARFAGDSFRERERAMEATVAPLGAIVVVAVLDLLLGAFSRDGEHAVVDLHLDVLLAQPRQIGAHDEILAAAERLER